MFNSVFDPESWRPIFQPLGNEAGIDGIDLYRASLPDGSERMLPMIAVRGIREDEIEDRAAAGDDPGDLIYDHSSYFWFSDRTSYEAAFRAARMISKGGKIINADIAPRTLFDLHDIDGLPVNVIGDFSAYHLSEAV